MSKETRSDPDFAFDTARKVKKLLRQKGFTEGQSLQEQLEKAQPALPADLKPDIELTATQWQKIKESEADELEDREAFAAAAERIQQGLMVLSNSDESVSRGISLGFFILMLFVVVIILFYFT